MQGGSSSSLMEAGAHKLWDATAHWTQQHSLQIPKLREFLFAIVTRAKGGIKIDHKRSTLRKLQSADFLVISGLALAYFCSIFTRISVSVLAPELQIDSTLSYDSSKHGQVIIAVQLSFLFGRLINGFIIDMTNPRIMLLIYLIGASTTIFIMSSVHTIVPDQDQRFNFLLGCAIMNALFQSGTWSAATKFIHDHFRPAQFGRAIVILGVCSRFGSVASYLSLSAVVGSGGLYWIDAMRIAAGITLFGCLFLLSTWLFPHPATHLAANSPEEYHEKKHKHDAFAPSEQQLRPHGITCSLQTVKDNCTFAKKALVRWLGWWSKRQFVIVAVANASMAIVASTEGLEAFLTLYFFNGLKVPSSVASQSAIVLPFGVAVSLIIGGVWIERLDGPSKADVVLLMLMVSVIFAIILLVLTGGVEATLSTNNLSDTTGYLVGVLISIFLIGASMGYAFFVPISTFALTFGGEHAALATSTISVFSSCVGAGFSAAVGSLAKHSWSSVMGIVLAFAILALVSMTLYYYFELVDKRTRRAKTTTLEVMKNLQELVVHQPNLHLAANGPANNASFFNDPVVNASEEPHHQSKQVNDIGVSTDHSLLRGTVSQRWLALREIYGPGLRHDGNHRVSKKIAILFFLAFVVFGVSIFVAYFVARTNPSFVFPFGDVEFANKTQSLSPQGG